MQRRHPSKQGDRHGEAEKQQAQGRRNEFASPRQQPSRLKEEESRNGDAEIDSPTEAFDELIFAERDVQQTRVEPHSLAVEVGKDGEPDQEGVESTAQNAEADGDHSDSGEGGTEEQIRLIAMEGAQDLVGGEWGVDQDHAK